MKPHRENYLTSFLARTARTVNPANLIKLEPVTYVWSVLISNPIDLYGSEVSNDLDIYCANPSLPLIIVPYRHPPVREEDISVRINFTDVKHTNNTHRNGFTIIKLRGLPVHLLGLIKKFS